MTSVVVNEPLALAMALQGASFREIARAAGGCHGIVQKRLLKYGYRRQPRCKMNQDPRVQVNGDVAVLELPCGRTALLDADCVCYLEKWTWTAHFGSGETHPYVSRQTSGRYIKLHRLIIAAQPGQIVDHINGDTLDNRKVNPRFASSAGNSQNRRPGRNNTSGYKGVSRFRSKWQCHIRADGRSKNLGHYATAEEAARAYDRAAVRYFGEFAWLNFPDRDHDPRSDTRDRRL